MQKVKIVECPRDGIQGIKKFIPTQTKIDYLNSLLKVGFDTLDFGSFVSPKAIPQMKDTEEVLEGLDLSNTDTKLLAIVANTRGGEIASRFDKITYLGYPFSVSQTFLKNNTNTDISKSLMTTNELLNICDKYNKELVVYISMSFGNPYKDEWSIEHICGWIDILHKLGVKTIALSDTIGLAKVDDISSLFSYVIPKYEDIEFGFHLHTDSGSWKGKVEAAYEAGCRRFDTVLSGAGGCPLSGYEMIGNLKTTDMNNYLKDNEQESGIDDKALYDSLLISKKIYVNSNKKILNKIKNKRKKLLK